MGIRICPECGGKVSTTRNDCPHCGYKFIEMKKCPDCEENIPIDSKECPVCGYIFNNEQVKKEELVTQEVKSVEIDDTNHLEQEEKEEIVVENTPIISEEANNNVEDEVINCPYCGSNNLMGIGINYFMCETCKGKFLNRSNSNSVMPSLGAMPLPSNSNIEESAISSSENVSTMNNVSDNVNDDIDEDEDSNIHDMWESELEESNSKKKSSKKGINILLIIIFLIVIGVGVFFILKFINDNKKQTTRIAHQIELYAGTCDDYILDTICDCAPEYITVLTDTFDKKNNSVQVLGDVTKFNEFSYRLKDRGINANLTSYSDSTFSIHLGYGNETYINWYVDTYDYSLNDGIWLPVLSKAGYTFEGWGYDEKIIIRSYNGYVSGYYVDVDCLRNAYYKSGSYIKINPIFRESHNGKQYNYGYEIKKEDNTIKFGRYPQTLVTNESIILELNDKAGTLPTSSNNYNWTSYNYYNNGNIENFMWYIDIDIDLDGILDYRGVYFTKYRSETTGTSTSYGYQSANGFEKENVYWFIYEDITWRIVGGQGDNVLLIANIILDSQDYYPSDSIDKFDHNGGYGYANNYALSNIRKWLNDEFYNTAFSSVEKNFISYKPQDNSKSSDDLEYVYENTEDAVFLPLESGFCNVDGYSDYAKVQGLDTSYGGLMNSRNIHYCNGNQTFVITNNIQTYRPTDGTYTGVCPMIWLDLS